jgi:hypothetical protein
MAKGFPWNELRELPGPNSSDYRWAESLLRFSLSLGWIGMEISLSKRIVQLR